MEFITSFITQHAQQAHYIFFGLLLLAGLSIPISLDLLLIFGGILASAMSPGEAIQLYFWIFAGCCVAAWEAYWLGRLLGTHKIEWKWLRKSLTADRISRLNYFYSRYGFLTLFIGRFIPFGVRNCLFMTAGMGRMPFFSFVVRDGIACFVSTLVLFVVAFSFGKNSHALYQYLETYKTVLGFFLLAAVIIASLFWLRRRTRTLPATGD